MPFPANVDSSLCEQVANPFRSFRACHRWFPYLQMRFSELQDNIGADAILHAPARFAVKLLEHSLENWINGHYCAARMITKKRMAAKAHGQKENGGQRPPLQKISCCSLTVELSSHATE